MSLAEIEKAVDKLLPEELTKLATHIARSMPKSIRAISRRFRDVTKSQIAQRFNAG